MTKILILMALMFPTSTFAVESTPADICRRADTPECRASREAVCQRAIESWPDKFAQSREASPAQREDTVHLLTEARERIARNQRGRVQSCQTPYELNGGRDRCKYSDTADCLAERQRRCGLAIDGFIEQVAQIDRTVEPREAARAAKVVEFKKRVFDNRRAGIAECQTWSELSVMAAR